MHPTLCLALLAGPIAPSWMDELAPPPRTVEPISVRIVLDVTNLLPREPLHLIVELRNASAAPVRVSQSVWGGLEFWVATENKAFALCDYGARRAEDVFGSFALAPGARICDAECIALGIHRRTTGYLVPFREAGSYRLKARLSLPDGGAIESAEVSLVVRVAHANEAEVAALVGEDRNLEALVGRVQSLESERFLRRIVDRHPKSAFADHARYRLGCNYQNQAAALDRRPEESERRRQFLIEAIRLHREVSGRVATLRRSSLIESVTAAGLDRGLMADEVALACIREVQESRKLLESLDKSRTLERLDAIKDRRNCDRR